MQIEQVQQRTSIAVNVSIGGLGGVHPIGAVGRPQPCVLETGPIERVVPGRRHHVSAELRKSFAVAGARKPGSGAVLVVVVHQHFGKLGHEMHADDLGYRRAKGSAIQVQRGGAVVVVDAIVRTCTVLVDQVDGDSVVWPETSLIANHRVRVWKSASTVRANCIAFANALVSEGS